MKRIGMLGPFDPTLADGVSSSMFDLLMYLKELGHETFIVSFLHDTPLCRDLLGYQTTQKDVKKISKGDNYYNIIYKGLNVYLEILPYNRGEMLSGHPDILKSVIEKIGEYKGDYIFTTDADHTSLFARHLIGVSGAHFFHSPSYINSYIHEPICKFHSPSYINGCIHQPICKKILQNTTVFAVSKFAQNELKKLINVDAAIWFPLINLDKYIAEKDVKFSKSVGYYSAGAHKGDRLVCKLIEQMPRIDFFVMGRNFEFPSDAFPKNLKYQGNVTDVKKFYRDISVLIVPSIIREGYPRVILEAAINGIPAIANKIGGIPEALGKSGILIDMEVSEAEMVNKYILSINRLLDNPREYAMYSKKAFERAKEYKEVLQKTNIENYNKYIQCKL